MQKLWALSDLKLLTVKPLCTLKLQQEVVMQMQLIKEHHWLCHSLMCYSTPPFSTTQNWWHFFWENTCIFCTKQHKRSIREHFIEPKTLFSIQSLKEMHFGLFDGYSRVNILAFQGVICFETDDTLTRRENSLCWNTISDDAYPHSSSCQAFPEI